MQIHKYPSPNFDERPIGASIDFIILHYTEIPFDDALKRLCDPGAKVSCHYLIKEDGEIFQLVDDRMRSWHAGPSSWRGIEALNNSSIGIEIDNLGENSFHRIQMESCISLCKMLIEKHNINPKNIIGHSDIAPGRKLDPGLYFDWGLLAESGLGLVGTHNIRATEMPSIKLIQERLLQVGYKVEVTGIWDQPTNNAVRAFQSHFCQEALLRRGVRLYKDMESKYSWDEESESALVGLLTRLSSR
jgi:N-acetylmuramoyl-L-alanine amidase